MNSRDSYSADTIRIGVGILLPFMMQFVIYALYTMLRFGHVSASTLFSSVLVVFPAFFIFVASGRLIWKLTGMRQHLIAILDENLDTLFIGANQTSNRSQVGSTQIRDLQKELSPEQLQLLRSKIRMELIPDVVTNAYSLYRESYINRQHRSRYDRLLTYYESLFLFGFVSATLVLADLLALAVLSKTSITLDFLTLDQISNPMNIAIIGSLLLLSLGVSTYLSYYTSTHIRTLIPRTVPIIYPEPEQARLERQAALNILANAHIEGMIGRRLSRSFYSAVEETYKLLLTPVLTENLEWEIRRETARQAAWRKYANLLDSLQLSENAKKNIREHFFSRILSKYGVESSEMGEDLVQGMKLDLEYVTKRIENWKKISSEEKTLAFMLLYRTAESFLRTALTTLGKLEAEETNLLSMINFLRSEKLITVTEKDILHRLRHIRNVLTHEPGKAIELDQKAMLEFLDILQSVTEKLVRLISENE